jgi:hypothetical protein
VSFAPKYTVSSIGEIPVSAQPADIKLRLGISEYGIKYFAELLSFSQVIFFAEYNFQQKLDATNIADALAMVVDKDAYLRKFSAGIIIGLGAATEIMPVQFYHAIEGVSGHLNERLGVVLCSQAVPGLTRVLDSFANDYTLQNLRNVHLKITGLHAGKLVAHIDNNVITVSYIAESGELKFSNNYNFITAEDCLYYLLLSSDGLKLDRNNTALVLFGSIQRPSKIYDLLFRYFQQITFAGKPGEIYFSNALQVMPEHLHIDTYLL